MLEIRTLGGLSIRVNGQPLRGAVSTKARALLAYLAVEKGQHARNELANLFWPESTDALASTSLRVALYALRKDMAEYLDVSRDLVAVKPGADIYLDLSDLEGKLAAGQIEQALELYRGDFLQGFEAGECLEFEHWLRLEQEHARGRLAAALHASVARAMEVEDYQQGRAAVERLLELEPLDERAYYQSIKLLALEGQRSAALAQYEKCRSILQEELGAEPCEELQVLHRRILSGEQPESLRQDIPKHNLPVPQTSFIGRATELREIGALLQQPDCRLVTIAGPGGSGKTRLALRVAGEAQRGFTDGVYFVAFESGGSPEDFVLSIAAALHFDIDTYVNGEDPKEQLLAYLKKRSVLLVLDSCEHLAGLAREIQTLLENAPNLRVLATSRQRLGLQSEQVFPVAGLQIPRNSDGDSQQEAEAVQLFQERARQASADFRLTPADYESIARFCLLVEGMPLAIELAAAWTPLLSPLEILSETEKSLDFLATAMVDVPEKHRSLRAVFDSSWSLLSDELQIAFCKLSVFRGGFDQQAARQITGTSLQQLSALLNRSLLRKVGAGHFTMHSLLRQYAAEKLGEVGRLTADLQERFCDFYVDLLLRREADLMSTNMLQARDEIRRDMDNVRSAVSWASVHWGEQPARKMLTALLCFYAIHGWHEGVLAFREIARMRREALIERKIPDPPRDRVFLSARTHEAFLLCHLGQIGESEQISQECLEALNEDATAGELSECLQNLGVNACFRGEYEHARELLEKSIMLGRECNCAMWPVYLLWLGYLYFLMGEYEQGMTSLQKSRELFDRSGTLWGTAFALSKMGLAADGLGEHEQAKRYHQDALAVFDRLGSQAGVAYALSRMSMSAYFLEQYPQAAQFGLEGYHIFNELGHRWGICTSLCALGFAQIGLGDGVKARQYFLEALKESRPDQIMPQSLHSLIGLACSLAQDGQAEKALEIIRFVRQHQETPMIYLALAARWIGDLEQASSRYSWRAAGTGKGLESIDEMAARLLG